MDRTNEIQRVLITGVGGSAAKYFIKYLRIEHPQVEIHGACRRKNHKIISSQVKLHEVDLLDFSSIFEALWESKPDVVFHFAANSDKGFETPSAIIHNNAVGTTNLFEAIRQYRDFDYSGIFNPIIVNVSSSEVYGDVDPEVDVPIKESCPFRPMSPYAISKVAQDHLGRFYFKAYGLKIITTRAFSYVNFFHRVIFTSAFAKQIALIEAGKLLPVIKVGNLDSVRCFVDTEDIMHAYWLTAAKCQFGEAYNIGGTYVASVGDILKRMLEISGVKAEIKVDPDLCRPADVTLQIPNCSKFRTETGWTEHFHLDHILERLLNHYRMEAEDRT